MVEKLRPSFGPMGDVFNEDFMKENLKIVIDFNEGDDCNEVLIKSLNYLNTYTSLNGTLSIFMDQLLNVLATGRASDQAVIAIIDNFLPDEDLTENQIDKLFRWLICLHSNTNYFKSLCYCLEWIFMAIHTNVIKKEYIQQNYSIVLGTIMTKLEGKLLHLVSYILKMTMGSCFRSNAVIHPLLKFYSSSTGMNKKHYAAVLEALKPYCTDHRELITLKLVKPSAPPKISTTVTNMFDAIRQNRASLFEEKENASAPVEMQLVVSGNEGTKKEEFNMCLVGLPPQVYTHTFFPHRALIHVESLQELINLWDRVIPPSVAVSAISSPAGRYYTALTNRNWQETLNRQVEAVLKSILHNNHRSDVNPPIFLSALASLQNILQQGLPSVTNFLSKFFIRWDGHIYRNQVFRLIPWIHFNNMDELSNILESLYNVFTFSNLEFKLEMFKSFEFFFINVVSVHLYRIEAGIMPPVVKEAPSWTRASLREFHVLIGNFINAAVMFHHFSPATVLAILEYYYSVAVIEVKQDLKMWTLIPAEVVIFAQFSSSYVVLNQLCSLLLWYCEETIPYFYTNNLLQMNNEIFTLREYCKDTAHILWNSKETFDIKDTKLASLLGEVYVDKLKENVPELNNLLKANFHSALVPSLLQIAGSINRVNSMTKEDCIRHVESFAPSVASFIKKSETYGFVDLTNAESLRGSLAERSDLEN